MDSNKLKIVGDLFEKFNKDFDAVAITNAVNDYITQTNATNVLQETFQMLREEDDPQLITQSGSIDVDVLAPVNIPTVHMISNYYDSLCSQLGGNKFSTIEFENSILTLARMVLIFAKLNTEITNNLKLLNSKNNYYANSLGRVINSIAPRTAPATTQFEDARNLVAVIMGLNKIAQTNPTLLKKPEIVDPVLAMLRRQYATDGDQGIKLIENILTSTSPQFEATKLLEFFKFPKEAQVQSQAAVLIVILYLLNDIIDKASPLTTSTLTVDFNIVDHLLKKYLNQNNPYLRAIPIAEPQNRMEAVAAAKSSLSSITNSIDNMGVDMLDLTKQLNDLRTLTGHGFDKNFAFDKSPNFIKEVLGSESFFGGATPITKSPGFPPKPTKQRDSEPPRSGDPKKLLPRRKPQSGINTIDSGQWPSKNALIKEITWANKMYNTIGEIIISLDGQNLYTPLLNTNEIEELTFPAFYGNVNSIKSFAKTVYYAFKSSGSSVIDLVRDIANENAEQIFKSIGHAFIELEMKKSDEILTKYLPLKENESLDEKIFNEHALFPYNVSFRTMALINKDYIPNRVLQMPIHIIGTWPPYQMIALLVFYALSTATVKITEENKNHAAIIGHQIMTQIISSTVSAPAEYLQFAGDENVIWFVYNRILDLILEGSEQTMFKSDTSIVLESVGSPISLQCANYAEYIEVSPVAFSIACLMKNSFSRQSQISGFFPNSSGVATTLGLLKHQTDFLKNGKDGSDTFRLDDNSYSSTYFVNMFKITYEYFIKQQSPKLLLQAINENQDDFPIMNLDTQKEVLQKINDKFKEYVDNYKTANRLPGFGANYFGGVAQPKVNKEEICEMVDALLVGLKQEEKSVFSLFLSKDNNVLRESLEECCDQLYDKTVNLVILNMSKSEIANKKFLQKVNEFSVPISADETTYSNFILRPKRTPIKKMDLIRVGPKPKDDEMYLMVNMTIMTIIYKLGNISIYNILSQKNESAAKVFKIIQAHVVRKFDKNLTTRTTNSMARIFELIYNYLTINCVPIIPPNSTENFYYEIIKDNVYKTTTEFNYLLLEACYDYYISSFNYTSEVLNKQCKVYCLEDNGEYVTRSLSDGFPRIILGGASKPQSFWEQCKRYYMNQQKCLISGMCAKCVCPGKGGAVTSFFEVLPINNETDGFDPGYLFYQCECTTHTQACTNQCTRFELATDDCYNFSRNFQIQGDGQTSPSLLVPTWVIYMVENFHTTFFFTKKSQNLFVRISNLITKLREVTRRVPSPFKYPISECHKSNLISNMVDMVIYSSDESIALTPNVPFVKLNNNLLYEMLYGLFFYEGAPRFDLFGGATGRSFRRRPMTDEGFVYDKRVKRPSLGYNNVSKSLDEYSKDQTTVNTAMDTATLPRSDIIDLNNDKLKWVNWSELKPPPIGKNQFVPLKMSAQIEASKNTDSIYDLKIEAILKELELFSTLDPSLKKCSIEFVNLQLQYKKANSKSGINFDYTITRMIEFFKYLMRAFITQIHLLDNNLINCNQLLYVNMSNFMWEVEILTLENYFVQMFIRNSQMFLHAPSFFEKANWYNGTTFKCIDGVPEFASMNVTPLPAGATSIDDKLLYLKAFKKNNVVINAIKTEAEWTTYYEMISNNNKSPGVAKLLTLLKEFIDYTPLELENYTMFDTIKWSRKKPQFHICIFLYGLLLDAFGVEFEKR